MRRSTGSCLRNPCAVRSSATAENSSNAEPVVSDAAMSIQCPRYAWSVLLRSSKKRVPHAGSSKKPESHRSVQRPSKRHMHMKHVMVAYPSMRDHAGLSVPHMSRTIATTTHASIGAAFFVGCANARSAACIGTVQWTEPEIDGHEFRWHTYFERAHRVDRRALVSAKLYEVREVAPTSDGRGGSIGMQSRANQRATLRKGALYMASVLDARLPRANS